MKQNRIEEVLRAIAENKTAYARGIETLRRDTHYSDAGRNDLADKEWQKAKQKHDSLKLELQEAIADERARLERQAFNAPRGNEQPYRDAISKASVITDRSAREKAIQLALKTNDTVMLRALAAVSHSADEQGWNTIALVAEHDRDIASLVEFEQEHGVLRGVNQKFSTSVELGAPSKPNMHVERKSETSAIERDQSGRRIW